MYIKRDKEREVAQNTESEKLISTVFDIRGIISKVLGKTALLQMVVTHPFKN